MSVIPAQGADSGFDQGQESSRSLRPRPAAPRPSFRPPTILDNSPTTIHDGKGGTKKISTLKDFVEYRRKVPK
ncbi:MAG: hypothetical protein OXR07_04215 [Nitrospira sp.]|nr:hypothetical protein [Nitrospira sp.]